MQGPDEVIELPGHCMACNGDATTRVFQTSIPYFKVPLSADVMGTPRFADVTVAVDTSTLTLHQLPR